MKHAFGQAPPETRFVSAKEAFASYKAAELDVPFTHFSQRTFLTYLHLLADEGLVRCTKISRGRQGTSLMVEMLPGASQ